MLDLIDKGGIISWILLVLSVLTIFLIILKIIQFISLRLGNIKFVDSSLTAVANDQTVTATNQLRRNNHPIARTMLRTLMLSEQNRIHNPDARDNIRSVGNFELARLRSYLSWLDTIAHIAPMIGLLGTVVGMIKAFRELSGAGVQVDITMLSTGIWEALITTAIGLVISVIALIAVNAFENKVNLIQERMSIAINHLLEILN